MKKLDKKLIIASMEFCGVPGLASLLSDGGHAVEFSFSPEEEKGMLGNIYVGIVEHIQENIGAAFVRIRPGVNGYLPLKEGDMAVYKTRKKEGAPLRPGDELLVQVETEAMKQKQLRLTANLSFSGRYLVLTSGKRTLNFSRKLDGDAVKRLKKLAAPLMDGSFGMIVRTGAARASEEELTEEWKRLHEQMKRVTGQGITRTCCSCVWQAEGPWIGMLKQYLPAGLARVVTDHPQVYREIGDYLRETGCGGISLELYQDSLLPLARLYAMGTLAESLRQRQVWLRSGGFLVIEQTEAFAAIDVNTGKYTGKKASSETFFRINMEAAAEAARQIRLRQLSGTILIDFINMDRGEQRHQVLECLRDAVKEDPVRTTVVDMTPLQIAEITRTKEKKSFGELMRAMKERERENGKENG